MIPNVVVVMALKVEPEEKSVVYLLKLFNEKNGSFYFVMEWFETYRTHVFGEEGQVFKYNSGG